MGGRARVLGGRLVGGEQVLLQPGVACLRFHGKEWGEVVYRVFSCGEGGESSGKWKGHSRSGSGEAFKL